MLPCSKNICCCSVCSIVDFTHGIRISYIHHHTLDEVLNYGGGRYIDWSTKLQYRFRCRPGMAALGCCTVPVQLLEAIDAEGFRICFGLVPTSEPRPSAALDAAAAAIIHYCETGKKSPRESATHLVTFPSQGCSRHANQEVRNLPPDVKKTYEFGGLMRDRTYHFSLLR